MSERARPSEGPQNEDRAEARRRFGRLPERVSMDELVESEPQAPSPEPSYDGAADAIRWYGTPL